MSDINFVKQMLECGMTVDDFKKLKGELSYLYFLALGVTEQLSELEAVA